MHMNVLKDGYRYLRNHLEYYWPALFFLILLAFTLVTAVAKPVRVVQMVPMMVLWPLALLVCARFAPSLFRSRRYVLFTLVVTYLPLMNTWPARIFRDGVLHLDTHGWAAFLQPVFIGLCTLLALFPPKLRRRDAVFLMAMGLWAVGGVISLLRTPDLSLSVEHLVAGVFTPILAYLVFVSVPLIETEWLAALSGFFVAALCPVVLGFLGYFGAYGVPLALSSFMHNKMQMYLVSELQTFTYGNVDHLAEFLLLTLIPAVGFLSSRSRDIKFRNQIEFVFIVYVVLATVLAVLIQVRGMVIVLVTALILAGIYNLTRRRFLYMVPTAAVFAVVVGSSLLLYGSFYGGLVPKLGAQQHTAGVSAVVAPEHTAAAPLTRAEKLAEARAPVVRRSPARALDPPRPGAQALPDGVAARQPGHGSAAWFRVKDTSANLRWDAIQHGIQVLKRAWPWGVGIGAYEVYAPQFTAAHSFAVQVVAETGLLGALFVIVLLIYVAARFILSWSRQRGEFWAALTCGAFVAYMYAFSGVMAIIGISVWGAVFALWVARMERWPSHAEEPETEVTC